MNNPEYSIFEMSYYFSLKSLVLKFSLIFFLQNFVLKTKSK